MLQAFKINAATYNGKPLDLKNEQIANLVNTLIDYQQMSPSAIGYSEKTKEVNTVLAVFAPEDVITYTVSGTVADIRLLTSREAKKRVKPESLAEVAKLIKASK